MRQSKVSEKQTEPREDSSLGGKLRGDHLLDLFSVRFPCVGVDSTTSSKKRRLIILFPLEPDHLLGIGDKGVKNQMSSLSS